LSFWIETIQSEVFVPSYRKGSQKKETGRYKGVNTVGKSHQKELPKRATKKQPRNGSDLPPRSRSPASRHILGSRSPDDSSIPYVQGPCWGWISSLRPQGCYLLQSTESQPVPDVRMTDEEPCYEAGFLQLFVLQIHKPLVP